MQESPTCPCLPEKREAAAPGFGWEVGAGLVPMLLTLVLYARGSSLFHLSDDFHYLYVTSKLSTSLSSFGFATQSVSNPNLYRPLTTLFYSANQTLSGTAPFSYHLGILALAAATMASLFVLLRCLGAERWCASLATCVYAALPCQVDVSTWPAAAADSLVTLFGLLSLLCVHLYRSGRGAAFLPLCAVATTLALLSKEPAVGLVLPLAYLLVRNADRRDWRLLVGICAVGLPFAAYVVLRMLYKRYLVEMQTVYHYYADPEISKIGAYARSSVDLLCQMLVPLEQPFLPTVVGVLLAASFVLTLAWLCRSHALVSDPTCATLIALGLLIVVSTVPPTAVAPRMEERYAHLPATGAICVLTALLHRLRGARRTAWLFAVALLTLAIVTYGAYAWERVSNKVVASRVCRTFVDSLGRLDTQAPPLVLCVPTSYVNAGSQKPRREPILNINLVRRRQRPREGPLPRIQRVFFHRTRADRPIGTVIITGPSPQITQGPDGVMLVEDARVGEVLDGWDFTDAYYFDGKDMRPLRSMPRWSAGASTQP